MTHLIVCREYPPAPYPAGGIGTYAKHIANLLADAGEKVHVITQHWQGASLKESMSYGGKLIIHRLSLEEPVETGPNSEAERQLLRGFTLSDCPSQTFSWQVAQYCERLVETEEIDVIEAQEWEAPLYYLQLRRAFGLGPEKQPPCLIHLHSPTRLIFQHNQWDTTLTDFLPLSRREEYSIQAADGLICPSRYLANEAERLFSLKPGVVQVIPYPLGDTPTIERTPETWERNSVCYVGRIELRKGVVEWVDAAIQVAESRSDVRFEFVGSDTSLTGGAGASVREYLDQRIPRHLRPRFRFHGSQSREDLLRTLATVSLAVVPSQWDNLPFTCIEAMSTGLPVLASPNGGMAELITDGESGWIAPDATPAGLARSLRLALDTSGIRRAAMGAQASSTVRRLSSNESILGRNLELRSQLARDGTSKSRQVPGFSFAEEGRAGMGVVVTCIDRPEFLQECLSSIREQTAPAKMVVAVVDERHRGIVGPLDGVQPIYVSASSSEAARTRGANELLTAMPQLRGAAFLNEDVRLDPNYLRICESAFEHQTRLGVLSTWMTCPAPIFPEGATPEDACVAMRAESLAAPGKWAAATYPRVLASVLTAPKQRTRRFSVMALAQKGNASVSWNWFMSAPLTEKSRWVREAIVQPRRTAQWVGWQLRRIASRAFA